MNTKQLELRVGNLDCEHAAGIDRAEEPPEQSPGGKYREIIPLR